MAVVVDMGLFGSDGLGTTVGKGAANPLQPGEINTIQRLTSTKDDYEFVVHRKWQDAGERSEVKSVLMHDASSCRS